MLKASSDTIFDTTLSVPSFHHDCIEAALLLTYSGIRVGDSSIRVGGCRYNKTRTFRQKKIVSRC